MKIAQTPDQVRKLLEEPEGESPLLNKIVPVKTVQFKAPSPMEAIQTISGYPQIDDELYLERKRKEEEEDYYLLRREFSQLAQKKIPQINRVTSILLGEAFAKKVRFGVTYSPEIENVISVIISDIY